MEAKSAITVNASPEDVYAAWRDFDRLPTFMYRLETERLHALRQAVTCCRGGGVVSVIGGYGGMAD